MYHPFSCPVFFEDFAFTFVLSEETDLFFCFYSKTLSFSFLEDWYRKLMPTLQRINTKPSYQIVNQESRRKKNKTGLSGDDWWWPGQHFLFESQKPTSFLFFFVLFLTVYFKKRIYRGYSKLEPIRRITTRRLLEAFKRGLNYVWAISNVRRCRCKLLIELKHYYF